MSFPVQKVGVIEVSSSGCWEDEIRKSTEAVGTDREKGSAVHQKQSMSLGGHLSISGSYV